MDNEHSPDEKAIVPVDVNKQLALPPEIVNRGLDMAAKLEYQRNIQRYQKPLRYFSAPQSFGCIDFSRNGQYAVFRGPAAGYIPVDGRYPIVSVIEILSGKVTPLYGRDYASHFVVSVAISGTGNFALAGYDDGGILGWDIKNLIDYDFLGITYNSYEYSINHMVFSPDERYFAESISYRACIRETLTAKCLQRLDGHNMEYNQMAFSNDGSQLLIAGRGGTSSFAGSRGGMLLFDCKGNRAPKPLAEGKDIRAVSIFPDNKQLLSLESDGKITVWNTPSGKELAYWSHRITPGELSDWVSAEEIERAGFKTGMTLPYCPVRSVAASPDGTRILSGGGDNYMRLWSLDGTAICEYPHKSRAVRVAFLADGRQAVSASWDGSIFLWELPVPIIPPPSSPSLLDDH
jgi:WD40 repeat protein